MSKKLDIAKQLVDTLNTATFASRGLELLAEDAEFTTFAPKVSGRQAVVDAMMKQEGGLFPQLKWDAPEQHGDAVRISGHAPEGSARLGYLCLLHFKNEKISLIQQQDIRDARMAGVGRPRQSEPTIKLPQELKRMIKEARNSNPMFLSCVDKDGQPALSYRGSIHAYSDDQLAMWIRNPEGEFLSCISKNPRVALMYRENTSKVAFQFQGRARVTHDPAERAKIYAGSPAIDQNHDFAQVGAAVIVDLDMVEGYFSLHPWTIFSQRRPGVGNTKP